MPDKGKKRTRNVAVPPFSEEEPISDVYPVIDTDLARDNVENHIPEADRQDL